MTKLFQLALNFLRAGTTESSKRLLTVISYIVSLGIAIFCAVMQYPLENNVLILLLGCCGVSSTTYAVSNRNEVHKQLPKDSE